MSTFDPQAPGIPGVSDLVEIGRGGFGTVYRAAQPAMSRDVAVKVLTLPTDDDAAVRRFRSELSAMGRLSDHPNIVTVHTADVTPSGHPYLLMSFVAGGSLAERLRSGPMAEAEVVEMGIALAGALDAAHTAGVLHLDVKPANVLMSSHGPQLTDFGIAKLADTTVTGTATVSATIAYAAPELISGERPSPATDVYGLCATLHAALTGRSPFEGQPGEHIAAHLHRVVSSPAPDLRGAGVSAALAEVVAAGLSKEPSARPATAALLRERLRAAASGGGAAADAGGPVAATTASAVPVAAYTPAPPLPSQMPPPAPLPASTPAPPGAPTPIPAAVPMAAYVPPPTGQQPVTPGLGPTQPAVPPAGGSGRGVLVASIIGGVVILALVGALVGVLLAGDGEDVASASTTEAPDTTAAPVSTDSAPTSEPPEIEVPTTAAPTTAPPTTAPRPSTTVPVLSGYSEGDVVAHIEAFYDLIDAGLYDTAFSRLSPEQQAANDGLSGFVDFWTANVSGASVQGPTDVDLATGQVETTLVFDLVEGGQSIEDVTIWFEAGPDGLVQTGYRVNSTR